MKYQKYIQHVETSAKAPKALKQRTFKKIEQLSIALELLGFYSSMPKTLLNLQNEKETRQ